jgi:hypothetical protein
MHKALSLAIRLENTNRQLYGGTNPDLTEAAAMIRELAGDDASLRLLEAGLHLRHENMKMRDQLMKFGVRFSDDIYGNPQPTKAELLGRKAA